MSFSEALEEAVLEWIFKGQAFGTAPTTIYVSLHSSAPGDSGTVAELSGGGYARASLSADTATTANNWTAVATSGTAQVIRNNANITFATATANWTTATHFGLWDNSNTFLASGTISGGMTVQSGDTVTLTPNDLEVSAD